DRRANALGQDLLAAGLEHQSKLAAYLYNCPEYLESYFGALKVGVAPLNVNYRYGPDEVAYLLENADAEAVVFHAAFAPLLMEIMDRLPLVKRWYVVDDGSPRPEWATPYESVVGGGSDRMPAPWGRSGDDLILLYTGGTTGMPKGVMWQQHELFQVLGGGGNPVEGTPPAEDMLEMRRRIAEFAGTAPYVFLPACPLMHGTGQFSAFLAMMRAGTVVTLPDRRFDPDRVWQAVDDYGVNGVALVGDAFAKPLLEALDAHRDRYDLSSLLLISSSGVMWSQATKDGLTAHLPSVVLFDSLGSSEAVGMGASLSAASNVASTAAFSLGPGVKVLGPDDEELAPGSETPGVVALPGHVPVGYYKDEEKTARTFRTIRGVRYVLPGDLAVVKADGQIQLLGRSNAVINTGGEKVFAEEVEEVIKRYPGVVDAVCVGVPDDRFGHVVTALVQVDGDQRVERDELRQFVVARLAPYKAPRIVVVVPSIGRSPSGKVDYARLNRLAQATVERSAGDTSKTLLADES
ncbi:MAG: AMP-binding protein, partial [Acidimicrobiaceae bacterium]|nr:AMP-binding protein [Acidimicrobiaceae bacterium]